jgi:hypothetical protein
MRALSAVLFFSSALLPSALGAGSDQQSISAFPAYANLGCATSCFYQYKTVEYFGTILGCTQTAGLLTPAANDCYCAPATPTKVASWLSRCNQNFCGGADPTPAIQVYAAYCSANGFPNAAAAAGGGGGGSGGGIATATTTGASGSTSSAKPNASPPGVTGGLAVEGTLLIAAGLGLVSFPFDFF